MVDRMTAWECIGCGRLEASQPCLGICQDRKMEFVYALDYDALLARNEALSAVLRQLAHTTPRNGDWERTYLALQERARRCLAEA
ncbi:MAG: hypothetical protein JSS40_17595 [Proteobacteria bacterium]|nr:hypothetical protein [Pseudomonadota bacterium]